MQRRGIHGGCVEDSRPLVLIVDEVAPLVKLLQLELGFQGLRTDTVLIEDSPLAKAQALQPDAIVIGSVIPTPEFFSLLEQLSVGVKAKLLFINGTGNENDTATAMEMGAHDAISRPFLPEAMGLHIRGMLGMDPADASQIRRGSLTIDYLRRIVWKGEMKMALGTNEWGLLLALAKATHLREGEGISAAALLTTVWGEEYAPETQFLALWIDRLRKSLGDDLKDPWLVLGDIAAGYRLAD